MANVLTNNGTNDRMNAAEFKDILRAHFSKMLEAQKQDIRETGRLSPVVTYSMENGAKSSHPTSFKEQLERNEV